MPRRSRYLKLTIVRVYVDETGHDDARNFHGVGAIVWYFHSDKLSGYVSAVSRNEAIGKVYEMYPRKLIRFVYKKMPTS